MKITLESTTKIVELNGVPARVWEGETEHGVPCFAFVTRIAPSIEIPELTEAQVREFEADLAEQRAPSPAVTHIPMSLIL